MAIFIGHLLPGMLFSLLGTWWLYNVWLRHFFSRRAVETGATQRSRYTNTAVFPCPCLPRIPIEGIFKATVVPFGMIAEYLTGFDDNGHFVAYKNLQHLTMYFFFGLSGVVDILTFYKAPLPRGTDYAAGALGFAMEAILFHFHLHKRTPVDVQMHVLLLIAVLGCLVMSVGEAIRSHSVLAALARCHCIILQGTWLLQMAFLLYWPYGREWKTDSHEDIMVVTVLFCWHNAGIFVFSFLFSFFIRRKVRNLSSTSVYMSLHSLTKSSDGRLDALDAEHARKIISDESEDERIG